MGMASGVFSYRKTRSCKTTCCAPVTSQEISPKFYTACDVFLFPSFSETFGLPVLEAMSCGAPVVASSRGALPEITDGAALLVNPEEPEEIAAAVYQIFNRFAWIGFGA